MSRSLILLVWLLGVGLVACSSPNRGYWSGSFDGSVSGVVDFEINARGSRVKGKMKGKTSDGQVFEATLEGSLRRDYLRAEFEGGVGSGLGLAVPFTGTMTGSLDLGRGQGDWTCRLFRQQNELDGTWSVEQTDR